MVYTPNCYDWFRKKNKNGGELPVVSRGSKNRCDKALILRSLVPDVCGLILYASLFANAIKTLRLASYQT